MRDEDDADSVARKAPHQVEQVVDVGSTEHRGRLVENENPRVAMEGFRDLQHLLLRDAQRCHRRIDGNAQPQSGEELRRLLVHLAPTHHRAIGKGREQEVLCDAELREQAQFLVDGRDAQPLGGLGRINGDHLSIDLDGSCGGLVRP